MWRTLFSIQSTKRLIQRLFKCFKCLFLGTAIKLYIIGMISRQSKNMARIQIEATIPNSFSSWLFVKINVAKPLAVVTLVINVAFPTLAITRCRDFAWLPCCFISCWYLLIKKIQLGIPITMISGGIKAVKTVISYLSKPSIPKAHSTPIITVIIDMKVAR